MDALSLPLEIYKMPMCGGFSCEMMLCLILRIISSLTWAPDDWLGGGDGGRRDKRTGNNEKNSVQDLKYAVSNLQCK